MGSSPQLCASLAPVYRDDPRLLPLIGPGAPFEVEEVVLDGVRLRSFVRAPRTVLDCFQMGKAHADLVNVVYEDERWTFGEVRDRALRLARALRDELGVRPGDRVAIAMRNLPEFVVSFWGAALCGAIAVLVDPERLERVRAAGQPQGVKTVGVRGADGDARFDELIRREPLAESEVARPGPDDPVTILYTSGTTGRPKGALGTQRGAMANLWNMAFVSARAAILAGRKPAPPRQAASLSAAPLFHIGGMAAIIGGPMGGSKMVLMRKWNVEEALRLAVQEQLTSLGGVPAMARELFEHPEIGKLGLDVRGVPMGGSAVPPDLPLRALEIFGKHAQILNGYGLTETTSAVVINIGDEFAARPDSVGLPNLTADLKVIDPAGRTLGPGQVGELCMRSPQVVKGYWNDEPATKAAFVDGWFHSGDVGWVDDEGFVRVVDRIKDVVIRGGENVYCAEVEAVLHDHPAVGEVAIVGMEDRMLGERVCAAVVPRNGARVGLAELRAFAAQRLAAFKCPEALLLIAGGLPKTATGKIAKNELRALVRARAAELDR